MKLAVIGSRDFNNYEQLCEHLDKLQTDNTINVIISGGAKGADSLAAKYAKEHDIELIEHKPDWQKYGRGAGMVRNKLIIDDSDEVIAFLGWFIKRYFAFDTTCRKSWKTCNNCYI